MADTDTTTGCPHGMTTPAACWDCMQDGPVAVPPPGPEQLLQADHWIQARHEGRCARRGCDIAEGQAIGIVDGVGWCCRECAA